MIYISALAPDDRGTITRAVEGDWSSFVDGLREPLPATTPKHELPLISVATFRDAHRTAENVEAVYALGLDIDEAPIPTRDELTSALAPFRAVVHSTSSATATAPRWRAFVALDHPASGAEYRRIWHAFVAGLPFRVGQASKDPSRAWYVPRAGEDGSYDLLETTGAPLDVDALLAMAPPEPPVSETRIAATAPKAERRELAVELLGKAWPAAGRHVAQLALAGALRRDGWSREDALEVLCNVCRIAGDEDRPKRAATITATWAATAPTTGWTRLGEHVDPAIVAAARGLLDPHAEIKAELAGMFDKPLAAPPDRAPGGATDATDADPDLEGMHFDDWDVDIAPPSYLIEGLIPVETVGMLVALGSSCKTWTAISMGIAIARGVPWVGRFEAKQGGVLVADFESGRAELGMRVRLLEGGRPVKVPGFGTWDFPAERIDSAAFWERAARVAAKRGLKLLVVDSFAAGAPGVDENATTAATPLHLAGRFTNETGAGVLFIHHAKKDSGGDDRTAVRGSGAIYNACDWAYTFASTLETDTFRRVEMRCLKPCAGFKPAPVGLELSKHGRLTYFEDEAQAIGRNATNERDVRSAILVALSAGPIATQRKLREKIACKANDVTRELQALQAQGEIVFIKPEGYQLDGDEQRTARVVAALETGERFRSAAELGRAAHVGTAYVERLERRGVVCGSREGQMLLVRRHS